MAEANPSSAPNPQVLQSIVNRLVSEGCCASPTRILIYNNFDAMRSSVLAFVFGRAEKKPSAVVKMSKDEDAVIREYRVLDLLQNNFPGISPRPLFRDCVEPFSILAMEACNGRRLSRWSDKIKWLPCIVDRLISLQLFFRSREPTEGLSWKALIDSFHSFIESMPDLEKKRTLGRALQMLEHMTPGLVIPRIAQHGDFYFDNILVTDKKDTVLVLDWEGFGDVSMPGYDLFCLFLSFFAPWDADRPDRFFEDAGLTQCIRHGVRTCFDRLGVPGQAARGIFGLSLIQQFVSSYRLQRSSEPRLWQRIECFVSRPEAFWRVLEE